MATTKIHAIKKTVRCAIAYIASPEKTWGQALVTGVGCDPETAAIEFEITSRLAASLGGGGHAEDGHNALAYHLVQSFGPNDGVPAEEAHKIGLELAAGLLGDGYEYVVATHTDKGHVHNHIIFNATSHVSLRKFRSEPYKTAARIRSVSDRLCLERGLPIPKGMAKGLSYKEHKERAENRSWKSHARKALTRAMEGASSLEGFRKAASSLGVEADSSGKHIKYRVEGQKRWVRGYTLGPAYTLAAVEAELARNCEAIAKAARHSKAALAAASPEEARAALRARGVATVDTLSGRTWLESGGHRIPAACLGEAFAKAIGAEPGPAPFAAGSALPAGHTALHVPEALAFKCPDGLLVATPDGFGHVFIGQENICQGSAGYTCRISPAGHYMALAPRLDPDIPEAEQLETRFILGEELIRAVEVFCGAKPESVQLEAADIRFASLERVSISLPDKGMARVDLDASAVSRDACGNWHASIWPNWGYQAAGADKRPMAVRGSEVLAALASRDIASLGPGHIADREAAQAAYSKGALYAMAPADRAQAMEAMAALSAATAREARLSAELQSLDKALGYIAERARTLPIPQRAQQMGIGKASYIKRHKRDRESFEHASAMLGRMGREPRGEAAAREMAQEAQKGLREARKEIGAARGALGRRAERQNAMERAREARELPDLDRER
jgi:hypothetical protein